MATKLNPYVAFDGECEAALKFWAEALGGQIDIKRMGDAPGDFPPEYKNRVMHSTLTTKDLVLMASDSMPGQPPSPGGSISLCLVFDDPNEQTRVWDRLAVGATIQVPLAEQFWGRFGMLTDKFGVCWMLNDNRPQS